MSNHILDLKNKYNIETELEKEQIKRMKVAFTVLLACLIMAFIHG